jgi:hypothetical protein
MPADDLSLRFDSLTWVRLEARPFHIPPCIALPRLSVTYVEWFALHHAVKLDGAAGSTKLQIQYLRVGADRRVLPHMMTLL